jgi:dTDP-4-dehydrorhamnose reductase
MRVYVTGAGGFVGSNVVWAAARRGDEAIGVVRTPPELPHPDCRYVTVDLLRADDLGASIRSARPDAIVHTAILNDFAALYADRGAAWNAYVRVTHTLADAANEIGAALVYVSSDWVFDGTQAGADEATPPNPINYYGVLKAASELVTLERARLPVVARVAGVMGTHRARAATPRTQDAGFGYFVGALVDALERDEPFTVWESDAIKMRAQCCPTINMVATPSLASLSAEWILELAERGLQGIFHCCGGEPVSRMELARSAADVFGLDQSLLRSGPPDPAALPPAPIPRDTSLNAAATARALAVELPSVRELLGRFRDERATARGARPSAE